MLAAFTIVAIFSACQDEKSRNHSTAQKSFEIERTRQRGRRTHGDGDAIVAEDEGGVGACELTGGHGCERLPLT